MMNAIEHILYPFKQQECVQIKQSATTNLDKCQTRSASVCSTFNRQSSKRDRNQSLSINWLHAQWQVTNTPWPRITVTGQATEQPASAQPTMQVVLWYVCGLCQHQSTSPPHVQLILFWLFVVVFAVANSNLIIVVRYTHDVQALRAEFMYREK